MAIDSFLLHSFVLNFYSASYGLSLGGQYLYLLWEHELSHTHTYTHIYISIYIYFIVIYIKFLLLQFSNIFLLFLFLLIPPIIIFVHPPYTWFRTVAVFAACTDRLTQPPSWTESERQKKSFQHFSNTFCSVSLHLITGKGVMGFGHDKRCQQIDPSKASGGSRWCEGNDAYFSGSNLGGTKK